MYDLLTEKITTYFERHQKLDEIQREKLYLGILNIIINTSKTLLICVIAIIFGLVKEVLFLILVMMALRLTAAGLHAKSNIGCTISSLLIYIGSAYISTHYPINIKLAFIGCLLLTGLLYKYSPADTENKPILLKEHRKKLKNQTLLTCITLLVSNVIFFNTTLANLTMFIMLCQFILISPITYKLLKRSYKNYEKYERINY